MKDTIRELWYGNIEPMERCGAHDGEISRLVYLMEKNKESLSAQLTENQIALLQKYIDCTEEYSFCNATHAFVEGFSLACKLMAEAFVA